MLSGRLADILRLQGSTRLQFVSFHHLSIHRRPYRSYEPESFNC